MSVETSSLVLWGVDIAPFLPTFVSLSMVIFGWGIIYRNAKKLSSRNEAHSFASNIMSTLKDIETLSEDFWFKSAYNDTPISYEMLVIAKIKIIQRKLSSFSINKISIENIDDFIFRLRNACTSKSLSISNLSQTQKRICMNNIINSISSLELQINEAISNRYPHS